MDGAAIHRRTFTRVILHGRLQHLLFATNSVSPALTATGRSAVPAAHITQNWRGKALVSHEVVVELIAATTTHTGLKVKAERDESTYETGKKPDAAQMASINLTRAAFHGEWNYTLHPKESPS